MLFTITPRNFTITPRKVFVRRSIVDSHHYYLLHRNSSNLVGSNGCTGNTYNFSNFKCNYLNQNTRRVGKIANNRIGTIKLSDVAKRWKGTATTTPSHTATSKNILGSKKLIQNAESGINVVAGVGGIVGILIAYVQYSSEQAREQAETIRELLQGVNDSNRIFAKVIGYRHLQCINAAREGHPHSCDWSDRAAMELWLYEHHDALSEYMDENNDGYLTIQELQKGLMACMMPEEETYDYIDYLFRLTHEHRYKLKKETISKNKKKKKYPHPPVGTICVDDIIALKSVLFEKSRSIHDDTAQLMDFMNKAAIYHSLKLITIEQLAGIIDKIFVKNYVKNIIPLNIGYRHRVLRKLKKKKGSHVKDYYDDIEKSFEKTMKWQLLKLLSKVNHTDPSIILQKSVLPKNSNYYRFVDSSEGRRVLPPNVIHQLSSSIENKNVK